MVLITLATISGSVSFINGSLTLGQWVFKLANVPEDIRRAVEDLAGIHKDLNDGRELRRLKFDQNSKEQKPNHGYTRLNRAIEELEAAVKESWKTLQAQAVDRKTRGGGVKILNRFDWVLNGKDTFTQRQRSLTFAHSRLMTAMIALEGLPDVCSSSSEFLAPPPPYTYAPATVPTSEDYLADLSPGQKRKLRGRTTELIEENENGARALGEISVSQTTESDSYGSNNMANSRKMRKLWTEDDSIVSTGVPVETTEHDGEEYVPSKHHRKRHRK